jgi:DNA-directed RNA polymerase omega subunit
MPTEIASLVQSATKVIPVALDLVRTVARRVKEIEDGAQPFVETEQGASPYAIALREIIQGKLPAQSSENAESIKMRVDLDRLAAEQFPALSAHSR